mgnify:CR=1 FL=1
MNRIVIITGATAGYGLATAKKFKNQGDTVIVVSRNADKVNKIVSENGFDDGFALDVTNYDGWVELRDYVMNKYGRVDVLVNNAGGGISIVDTTEQTKEDIDKAILLNLNSVIYGCKIFADIMKKAGDGIIINISSVGGLVPDISQVAYGTSKAAINYLTKLIAVQEAKHHIRCNAVLPGMTATEAVEKHLSQSFRNLFVRHIPLGRIGLTEEIAEAVSVGALNIDKDRVVFSRVLDMNDRSLRNIVSGLGGSANGIPTETGFDITPASEIMAILCLAKDEADLRRRIENIMLGYTYSGEPFTVKDLGVAGSIMVLLKDAIQPNLVQTTENTPAIIHGGPFANIAHGCNSIFATKTAMTFGDYVITEAGFGADLGAEKFFNIIYSGEETEVVTEVQAEVIDTLNTWRAEFITGVKDPNNDADWDAFCDELEEKGLEGTVVFYGCPGEEVLTGKAFMAREGAFRDLDLAFSWHGSTTNTLTDGVMTGLNSAVFHFKGRTAHAGGDPHNGRSALDAAELMSVGANYLREHVTSDIRIHYSYKEAGTAPNIVPDKAAVWYYVRGGSREAIEECYNRLVKVAEGAAHMTETELERVLEFFNWTATEEGSKILSWGTEGVTYTVDAEGNKQYIDNVQVQNYTRYHQDFIPNRNIDAVIAVSGPVNINLGNSFEEQGYGYFKNLNFQLGVDLQEDMNMIGTLLNDTSKDWSNQFIMGLKDPNNDADWQAYLDALEACGLSEWSETYTNYYNENMK